MEVVVPCEEDTTHRQRCRLVAFVDLEERVPQDHPIRTIKIIADDALERLYLAGVRPNVLEGGSSA